MKVIESLTIKEKIYIEKLENGLTVMLVPKENTNKKYVIWGTHFGSIDNHFIVPQTNEEVKVSAKAETKADPKKPGRKPAAKKAAAPAKAEKKAPAKAVKPVITSVLQVAGNEFDFDKVVKAVEGLKKKNEGKSLEIYIKPEDNAIYYVVNGKGGKKIDI